MRDVAPLLSVGRLGNLAVASLRVYGSRQSCVYRKRAGRYGAVMSTITAILEADEDGTLHLPVPPELRNTKVRVTAILEAAAPESRAAGQTPLAALRELRRLGAFREIGDPVAWQRAQRQDRPLPGRE